MTNAELIKEVSEYQDLLARAHSVLAFIAALQDAEKTYIDELLDILERQHYLIEELAKGRNLEGGSHVKIH